MSFSTSRRNLIKYTTQSALILHPLIHTLNQFALANPEGGRPPSVPFEKWDTMMPYLNGVYSPQPLEQITPQKCKVIYGDLKGLGINGVYLRNGPNPKFSDYKAHHWFDGDGKIFKLQIENGEAFFQDRMVNTIGLQSESKSGKRLYTGMREGSRTGRTINNKFQNLWNGEEKPIKDTSNTDLIFYNGKIVSLWWLAGKPYLVDPATLETNGHLGIKNYSDVNMAAHAKVDEKTGDLFFLNYSQYISKNFVKIGCANGESLKWSRTFDDIEFSRIYHDVLFTKNYALLLDFPMGYIKNEKNESVVGVSKKHRSRIFVLDRKDGKIVKKIEFDPTYVLHGINAYEDGQSIILDVCEYKDAGVTAQNDSADIPKVGFLRLYCHTARWTLNLASTGKDFSAKILDDKNNEFPRINNNYLGSAYQYAYIPLLAKDDLVRFTHLMKFDVKNQKVIKTVAFGGSSFIGEEASYIPVLSENTEDGGYIGTLVHDLNNLKVTYFHIYHAQSMELAAKIEIPKFIPHGFHSKWINTNDLSNRNYFPLVR